MLDKLPRTQWPTLLRGDCSYGNEVLLSQAEVCRARFFRGNGAGSWAHYFVGTGARGTG